MERDKGVRFLHKFLIFMEALDVIDEGIKLNEINIII